MARTTSTPSDPTEQPLRTVAGVPAAHAADTIDLLEQRLVSLIDLEHTLKHVHWNVVGPTFISVHEMIDGFVDQVRPMTDDLAERIRTLGGVAHGTPGHVVETRHWDDYDVDEALATTHLRALDAVYDGIVLDNRRAIAQIANLDPVTEDLLIGQTAELEQMQWFVRSFLRNEQPGTGATGSDAADRMPSLDEVRAAEEDGTVPEGTAATIRQMVKSGAPARDGATN